MRRDNGRPRATARPIDGATGTPAVVRVRTQIDEQTDSVIQLQGAG